MVPAIEYFNNRDDIVALRTLRQLRYRFRIRQDILNTSNMRYNNHKSCTLLSIYISLLILLLIPQVTGAVEQNRISREIRERWKDFVNLVGAIPHILFLFLGARELIDNYLYDIMYGRDRAYIFWEIAICLFFASWSQYISITPNRIPAVIERILMDVPFNDRLNNIAIHIRSEPQGHNGSPLFSIFYKYFSDTGMICVRSLHYLISSHIVIQFIMYAIWSFSNRSKQENWVIGSIIMSIAVCSFLSISHNIMLYTFYFTLTIYYLVKLPDLLRSIYMYHTNPDLCKTFFKSSYNFNSLFQNFATQWSLWIKRYSDIALGIATDIEFLPFLYEYVSLILWLSQVLFMISKYANPLYLIILELLSRVVIIGLSRIVFLASFSFQMLSGHKSILEPSLIMFFFLIPLSTLRFTYTIEYPRVVYILFLLWMYYNQESIERWLEGRYMWIDTPIKLLIIVLVIIESKIRCSFSSIVPYEQILIFLYWLWYKDRVIPIILEIIALSVRL